MVLAREYVFRLRYFSGFFLFVVIVLTIMLYCTFRKISLFFYIYIYIYIYTHIFSVCGFKNNSIVYIKMRFRLILTREGPTYFQI